MGTTYLNVFNGRYRGSKLSEDKCKELEKIISLDKENGKCEELKHIICNISDEDTIAYINSYEDKNATPITVNKPLGELRDDQTLGVAFMYAAERCILGDSVGMGKTVESAGLIQRLKQDNPNMRFCVFTGTNLTVQFRKELVKFTGEYVTLLETAEQTRLSKFYNQYPYTSDKSEIPNVVGSHSLITAPIFIQWLEQYKAVHKEYPFDLFIVDESSILGGTDTKIVDTFSLLANNVPRIVFLNATPFETSLLTFYNQLNILDKSLMPTKTEFQNQFMVMDYTGIYPRPTGKYKNEEDFKQYIGYRYFARTRKDKGAKIENSGGGVIVSPLSKIQKSLLKRTTMYRMVYDCPQYLDPDIEFNEENVPKLQSLNSLLSNECKGNQVIIFVPYIDSQTEIRDWLIEKGYKVDVLNGKVKQKERTRIIDEFKNGDLDILITNVQKGLNFGNCNYCIFYSMDTNPSRMLQFEGRITRDFDIIGKNIYILCSEGKEMNTLNEVLRSRTKATTDFTNADISVILQILLENEKEQ